MGRRFCPECLKECPADTGQCPVHRAEPLAVSTADPRCGEVIDGRYLLVDVLGRGGMGVVYRAWQSSTQRYIALKLMKPEYAADGEATKRFLRESRITASLRSPHTVSVYDCGSLTDGTLYLAMEVLSGRSLADIIRDEGPLPIDRICRLARQICLSLEEAHASQLVHRDLKPQNISVEAIAPGVEHVKVLDFGLAKPLHDDNVTLTAAGQLCGTPVYMSPEQIQCQPVSAASDLYSLGVTLYEMATGTWPFNAPNPTALYVMHCTAQPPLVTQRLGDTPANRALEAIILKCLAKVPRLRHATAAELREDLDRVPSDIRSPRPMDREPRPSPAPSIITGQDGSLQPSLHRPILVPPGDSLPPANRRRRHLLVAGGGILIVASLVAATWYMLRPADAPPPNAPVAHAAPAAVAWPESPRLLVLPFTGSPERTADRTLWPLFDRMIVNILEPDDRFLGRIQRVDPLLVEAWLQRNEVRGTLSPGMADSLAGTFGANVVLAGSLRRAEDGSVTVDAELRKAGTSDAILLTFSNASLLDASRDAARTIANTLAPVQGPFRLSDDRASAFLIDGDAGSAPLGTLDGTLISKQRFDRYQAVLDATPSALGPAWWMVLEDPFSAEAARPLCARADLAPDPSLRQFFLHVCNASTRPDACAGIDLPALSAKYPRLLGPMAEAMCLFRKGDLPAALQRAQEAFRNLDTRPLALHFITRIEHYDRTCDEVIVLRDRLLRAAPENASRWSAIGDWYARCDRFENATVAESVARALLTNDRRTNRTVAHNAMLVSFLQLDLDKAREWMEVLDQNKEPSATDGNAHIIRSLYYFLQGRYSDGLSTVREGMKAIETVHPNDYQRLALAYFYTSLYRGDLDGATWAASEMGRVFADRRDLGNRYHVHVMNLVLQAFRSSSPSRAATVERIRALAPTMLAQLGASGTQERDAAESFAFTALDQPAACEDLLHRATVDRNFLGGCRLLHARQLQAQGRFVEAEEQFRQALKDIIWARIVFLPYVPAALFGRAESLAKTGDRTGAVALWQRLRTNYKDADIDIPEVGQALERLKAGM